MRVEWSLTEDILALLPLGGAFSESEAGEAIGRVWFRLIARMPGEPWKLSAQLIERLRESRAASLLRDSSI